MAAGSDLLDDVFFNTEVDEKVVSDLVGSLECELTGSGPGSPAVQVQVGGSARSDVQGSRTGLSQELAKAGTAGAQGGVINSTRSHGGSTVDAAAGTSTVTTAGSVTVADGQSKSEGTPPSHPGAGMTGKSGTAAAAAAAALQTLNGSSVVMNSTHNPSGTTSPPAVTGVNNGPGPGAKARVIPPPSSPSGSTVIQTPNPVTSTVISSQPPSATLNSSVPTVTLVRPPMPTMQSPGGSTAHGGTSTVVTSALHPPASAAGRVANNKFESPKTIIQTSTVAAAVKSPTILQNMSRTNIPTTVAAANPGGIRAIAPQVLAPRLPTQPQQNTPNIQNIQLPPGMVLVRSESGQLLMIHQQTLAQMQAQSQSQSAMAPRPATPTSTPSVQITSVQNTIMLGGTPATPGQPLAPPSPVQAGSAAATQRAGTPAGPTQVTSETLENVKKCKNFLSTLIKLASSGKQSSETTANVKELVKNLLEGKIEAEDFTSRLYKELNSSPQPYLVPFLKRSLPALRQMTPDSSAFIHQSQLPLSLAPPPPGHAHAPGHAPATALTAVVQRPPLSSLSSLSSSSSSSSSCSGSGSAGVKQSQVIAMTPIPHASKPGLMGSQMVRPPGALAQAPVAALRGGQQQQHGRVLMGTQGVKQLQAGPVKQVVVPGSGRAQAGQTLLTAAQRNKLREAGGTFRDDDDINDVASMAGVNLSEESARILATNSELVGAVTRSCKDEAFLFTSSLTRRVLEIGKRFGVAELGPEVINYISHAAQQRLQNLLEKVSQAAQQRNFTFKEDERYEQGSDVRAQLKFFEQLDQMEKQRKEEQEREILMKAAKSRSRQEDPEQLRLKQKAKEMQQQELAQIRQREANMTALAAIGPRKKRKMDSPSSGAAAEGSGSALSQSGGPSSGGGGGARQFARQRITRVNLRDLLFCLENERESSHSQLLYRGFLK